MWSIVLLASLTAHAAPTIEAPPIAVEHWISEGPAASGPDDQLQVVELWATWCGACHTTFPLLTRVQAEHGNKVRVVALTDDRTDRVRRFYHDHIDEMRFAVAVSTPETVQSLMFGGYGGRGLPSVYVVRDGAMLWSGTPGALEAALTRLGTTQAD
jgi:thiol-disulfide isomerase/thioredoxin